MTGPVGEASPRGDTSSVRAATAGDRLLHERFDLHALIDLSDGISSDLGHSAWESGVRATLVADRIPVHAECRSSLPADGPRRHALFSDGPRFELLLAVSPRGCRPDFETFVRSPAWTGIASDARSRLRAKEVLDVQDRSRRPGETAGSRRSGWSASTRTAASARAPYSSVSCIAQDPVSDRFRRPCSWSGAGLLRQEFHAQAAYRSCTARRPRSKLAAVVGSSPRPGPRICSSARALAESRMQVVRVGSDHAEILSRFAMK